MRAILEEGKSIYLQISEAIEDDILTGAIAEEALIPSTNKIARHYAINPATAAKGVSILVDEGIVYKKRGIGMCVKTGAKEIILEKRKNSFYDNYMVALMLEASKLGLVVGLAPRAPVTVFDEPSLGLDAVIRERFYDEVIRDFAEHPRTIIISTHLIDEVSRLFEDVIIIDGGKMLLKENCIRLKEQAFYLSGREEQVQAAAKDTLILGEENFGGTLILSVFAKSRPRPQPGVDIQPMPLQKLFVQLINPEVHETLTKGGVL